MLVLFGLASNEEFHVSSWWKGIVQCSIYGLEGGECGRLPMYITVLTGREKRCFLLAFENLLFIWYLKVLGKQRK